MTTVFMKYTGEGAYYGFGFYREGESEEVIISENQPVYLQQWIPCSERMPEDKQNVIAYFGGADTPFVDHDVYFNCGKFYWPEYQPGNYENEISKGHITHWMPLPAAPQEPTK